MNNRQKDFVLEVDYAAGALLKTSIIRAAQLSESIREPLPIRRRGCVPVVLLGMNGGF